MGRPAGGNPKSLVPSRLRALLWLLFSLSPALARADVIEVGPGDEVEAALNALRPGDELVLRGGTYELEDAWHLTLQGTEAAPIIVRAKQGERPHLHREATGENLIDFDRAQYVQWRGIEHSGGSHGLRLIDVSFMTIEDCEIYDTADVALSANSGGDYEGLLIRLNHIHDTHGTGEGMYLGCHDASCAIHDSLIEGNYIHHTNAADVEQGDGIEIKEGSYANVVRDNVIHDTNYPCIISYSTVGHGAPNVIERNLLWACGDNGIQSAADAVIRNNVILGAGASGIANQPHVNGTPSNLVIVHNTILAPDNSAISSSGITGMVLIANNAVYAQSGSAIHVAGQLAQVSVRGNVGEGGLDGAGSGLLAGSLAADFAAASYSNALPNDVFPKAGSALIGKGSTADVAEDDFNGSARNGAADVGAYRYDAQGNPGWDFAAAFKPVASGAPPQGSDAGSAGSRADSGTAGSAGMGGAGRPAPGGGTGGRAGSAGSAGHAGAGSGGASGAPSADSDGGVASDAGSAAGDDDSGCSCRIAARRNGTHPFAWGLLAWLALVRLGARQRGTNG
ncbi:MAG TPA: right-handed parallel beta-helix repeat-containing protein [Polyangiales bacterium]|nr:right-handed parallel beta-helix repeat-containing protein [Polyangiales bacterium]